MRYLCSGSLRGARRVLRIARWLWSCKTTSSAVPLSVNCARHIELLLSRAFTLMKSCSVQQLWINTRKSISIKKFSANCSWERKEFKQPPALKKTHYFQLRWAKFVSLCCDNLWWWQVDCLSFTRDFVTRSEFISWMCLTGGCRFFSIHSCTRYCNLKIMRFGLYENVA